MKKTVAVILSILCLLQLAACRRVPNTDDIAAVVPQIVTCEPGVNNVTVEIEDLDESIFNRNIKIYKAWPNFFGDISMQLRIRAHSSGNYKLDRHNDNFLIFDCSVPLSDIIVKDGALDKSEQAAKNLKVLPDKYIRMDGTPSYNAEFKQVIDGYTVYGMAYTEVKTSLDDKYIMQITKRWSKPYYASTVKTVSFEEALDRLERHYGFTDGIFDINFDKTVVKAVELVYYKGYEGDFFIPCYRFTGVGYYKDITYDFAAFAFAI